MTQAAPDLKTFLPLSPAVFHILLALAEGDRHGYGISKEVKERTAGAVRLGPGTLYRSIKQLLSDGWIEEADERADPALDDQRRRYYRLSGLGRSIAAAEAARLADLVDLARERNLIADAV
ncbi:PadR family transcriptional regulator [Gloeobacter kilaueensis]|uniref:PadR family transcriptional regulator n=1 Tax=Gloeobacter kilaueensis (strain ATCC BAA-2537 / CCAP 1431/1 / ULC 316 / JS1) TaxID=1183438 RepID=U5QNH0_GLOK1|nr:PadR family transcriptional regulator [Gloeobacter kilaueensis]AGY59149.1 PadR family transcriptional regulator [Gloeobacter kilaueensis JS1]